MKHRTLKLKLGKKKLSLKGGRDRTKRENLDIVT